MRGYTLEVRPICALGMGQYAASLVCVASGLPLHSVTRWSEEMACRDLLSWASRRGYTVYLGGRGVRHVPTEAMV